MTKPDRNGIINSESEVRVMYRFYIESVTSDGWSSMERNTYPLIKEVCERQLHKSLQATANAGRKVLRYWIEEVTE